MSSILSLQRVSKTFSPYNAAPITALNNISIEVEPGEFVCIVGANGSGKSTLLKVIAGVHRNTLGSVFLAAKNITTWSEQKRSRQITMVDQTPGARLAPDLTIEQNLALYLMRENRPLWHVAVRKSDRDRFFAALSPLGLGLETRMHARVRELSGGQAQALAVAAATKLVQPKLLLLDEHCAALDPRMSNLVMEATSALCRERGITTLMVTHDFRHAAEYGDRLILMREGNPILDVRGGAKSQLTPRDIFEVFMQQQV